MKLATLSLSPTRRYLTLPEIHEAAKARIATLRELVEAGTCTDAGADAAENALSMFVMDLLHLAAEPGPEWEVAYTLKDHQDRLSHEFTLGPFADRTGAEEALRRFAGADRKGSTLQGARVRPVTATLEAPR